MGYNFSMLNYDTIANGVQGSMNLHWNQAAMHNSVYPSLFMTPNMGNYSFTPYMNYSYNNWLLDPGFALTNAFNQFGMTCPWMNGGLTPGNTTSTAKTDEEIDAEENRKALEKIINELKNAKILNDADKRKIDNAKKEAKDAGEDLVGQYEAYKAKFDEIISEKDSKIREDLLEKGQSLKLEDGTTIMDARKKLGIGRDLTATGLTVDEMADGAITSSDKVLEYIAAFEDINGGQIINEIIGYGNDATESKAFEALQRALIAKANSLKSSLLPESRELISDAITALSNCNITYNADNGTTTYEPGDKGEIKEAFNKLYVLTRIAAATILDSQVEAKYGEFSQVFTQDVYKEAVIADLEGRVYNTSEIEITVDESASVDTDSMTEAERAEYEAEREKTNAATNTQAINDIIGLTCAYEPEEMDNGIIKLTPTDDFKEYSDSACICYYNRTNGKLTKANMNGDYDPDGMVIDVQAFRTQAFNTFDATGTNCLSNLKDMFKSNWINDGLNGEGGSYRLINDDSKKEITFGDFKDKWMQGAAEDSGFIKDYSIHRINGLIDEMATQVGELTFIDENIINAASDKLKNYYNDLITNTVNVRDDYSRGNWRRIFWDNHDGSKTFTSSEYSGRRNGYSEVKTYEFIDEDQGNKKLTRVNKTNWNYKTDSGFTIVFDDDAHNSWSTYIDKEVLVKKFEMYLAEEIQNTRNSLRNS